MLDEYLSLDEAADATGRTVQQLLRGALNGAYRVYQYDLTKWLEVPRTVIGKLYNGESTVSTYLYAKKENEDGRVQWIRNIEIIGGDCPDPEVRDQITWDKKLLHLRSEVIAQIMEAYPQMRENKSGHRSPALQAETDFPIRRASELMEEHTFRSEELLIAIKAWSYLYEREEAGGRKIRKNQVKDWLRENYPKLENNTVERIATVVNPFKKGGATPSD